MFAPARLDGRYGRLLKAVGRVQLLILDDCTPASGWEKGQVENQVGNLRDQLFRPKPRVKNLAELNAWLADQCIAYAHRTPTRSSGTGRSGRCSRRNGPV